jgi:hypothetical protein
MVARFAFLRRISMRPGWRYGEGIADHAVSKGIHCWREGQPLAAEPSPPNMVYVARGFSERLEVSELKGAAEASSRMLQAAIEKVALNFMIDEVAAVEIEFECKS